MAEDIPQHDSQKIFNFHRFLRLVILIKRIFVKKKQCDQKQSFTDVLKNRCFKDFSKFIGEILVPECLF